MSESQAADEETVLITHIFDAPRKRVFAAWSDPVQVSSWFGPVGMEVPSDRVRIDFRVGGRFELTMVRPDGGEMLLGYEIVELDEPDLLVLRSDPMPQMGMDEGSLVRVEFHDHGDKTRLTLSDGPFPAAGAKGAEAGWTAALTKLAETL